MKKIKKLLLSTLLIPTLAITGCNSENVSLTIPQQETTVATVSDAEMIYAYRTAVINTNAQKELTSYYAARDHKGSYTHKVVMFEDQIYLELDTGDYAYFIYEDGEGYSYTCIDGIKSVEEGEEFSSFHAAMWNTFEADLSDSITVLEHSLKRKITDKYRNLTGDSAPQISNESFTSNTTYAVVDNQYVITVGVKYEYEDVSLYREYVYVFNDKIEKVFYLGYDDVEGDVDDFHYVVDLDYQADASLKETNFDSYK